MNENEAKTLIERFAEKQQGNGPYLRCLRNAGGLGGHDGQHNSADRMGYRLRAGGL